MKRKIEKAEKARRSERRPPRRLGDAEMAHAAGAASNSTMRTSLRKQYDGAEDVILGHAKG
ncbi:MAG TPA: hypothetical protein VMT17_05775 [Anaeromyxobacteraceae bacterium]|nr:hypothetical protein [Anaeromyxobacteraceae bacterium]